MRQLNKYDFHKIRANAAGSDSAALYGDNAWEFKHPDFQLHNKDQIDNIKRKTVNSRKPANNTNNTNNNSSAQSNGPGTGLNEAGGYTGLQGDNGGDEGTLRRVQWLESELTSMRSSQADLTRELKALREQHAITLHRLTTLQQAHQVSDDVLRQLIVLESNGAAGGNARGGGPGGAGYTQMLELLTTLNTMESARNDAPVPKRQANVLPPLEPAQSLDQPQYGGSSMYNPSTTHYRTNSASAPAPAAAYLVLLVESDELSAKVCRKFLADYGCEVDVANDGLTAVKRAQACEYDLILMETVMPQLSGLSATALIREHEREREPSPGGGGGGDDNAHRQREQVPIVVMSSAPNASADMDHYYQRGVTDLLPKPFTRDNLVQMLDLYLRPGGGHGHRRQRARSHGGAGVTGSVERIMQAMMLDGAGEESVQGQGQVVLPPLNSQGFYRDAGGAGSGAGSPGGAELDQANTQGGMWGASPEGSGAAGRKRARLF